MSKIPRTRDAFRSSGKEMCSLRSHSHVAATLLLSVNSARCNDSVGLVGVRNLIYLHASINIREVGILVGEIRSAAGNLRSFWVTACLKK